MIDYIDLNKLDHFLSDHYIIDVVIDGEGQTTLPGYDLKKRNIKELKDFLMQLSNLLMTHPFTKKKLTINIGYMEDGFKNRDLLHLIVDEVIRARRSSNIEIKKGLANIDINKMN